MVVLKNSQWITLARLVLAFFPSLTAIKPAYVSQMVAALVLADRYKALKLPPRGDLIDNLEVMAEAIVVAKRYEDWYRPLSDDYCNAHDIEQVRAEFKHRIT
jgi:hypothetical protein